jgi:hypothetical protein
MVRVSVEGMWAFLVALALGAGAIALWLVIPLRPIRTARLRPGAVPCGLALAMGWLAVPAGIAAVIAAGAGSVVAVFTTAFPALTYMFLAGLWVVKHAQELLLHR